MQTESEAQLEERLMSLLERLGWQRATLILDEPSLESNFRNQFLSLNKSVFEAEPLTDAEFRRFLLQIKDRGVFQSASMLRQKQLLQRDDNTSVYVKLFDTITPSNNTYQVTNQITIHGKRENRYDVTLLINGLPVVQVELKKRGVRLKEAFDQINRYRRESLIGLFQFTQLFAISNGVDSLYLANQHASEAIPFERAFVWSDKENKSITDLDEFGREFLNPNHIWEMITTWMVAQESSKTLIAMRPYQIYAVKAALDQTLHTGNNGYIWHATGSGKTLTSWKLSHLVANHPNQKFAKVIFLVDRQDLNGQTLEEFNKFSTGSVDETKNTAKLAKQLTSKALGDRLIVTTIQKLNVLLSHNHGSIKQLQGSSVLFIIDECHRTQFGEMHKRIKHHFTAGQYIGFTGTPIFEENKSADKRTTTDVFGRCLHKYLMSNAIIDKNVLPFSIEYVNTLKQKDGSKDDLVPGVNTEEVWHSPERLNNVAEDVLKEFARKTNNGKSFNAIFAVDNVATVGKYFRILRAKNAELKLATIYSWVANEDIKDGDTAPRDMLDEAIADYNATFDTTYSTDTHHEYFIDLSKRMKRKEIDILIVAEMFLTGSDFPQMNTMFYDKKSRHHSLVQHFSRTNRTLNAAKQFGNIRVYRPIKDDVDEALALFNNSENMNVVLSRAYEAILSDLQAAVGELKLIAPTVSSINDYRTEEEQQEFVFAFRQVSRLIAEASPHAEYNLEESGVGINAQELEDYRSKYLDLYELAQRRSAGDKISILAEIDFEVELIHRDVIDATYLQQLIRDLNLTNKVNLKRDTDHILKQIDLHGTPQLKLKSVYLKQFFDKVLPTLTSDDDPLESLSQFEDTQRESDITEFAELSDIKIDQIEQWIDDYAFENVMPDNLLKAARGLGVKLSDRSSWIIRTQDFIQDMVLKYS